MKYIVLLLVLFGLGCSSQYQIGHFDAQGNRVKEPRDQVILVGFHNTDSVPYTLSVWTYYDRQKYFLIKNETVLPGNIRIRLTNGGNFNITVQKSGGVKYTHLDGILLYNQGGFIVNSQKVNMILEIPQIWQNAKTRRYKF